MTIIGKLKSFTNGSGAVADLERAIVQFEERRDQALAWLAGFDVQRRELLLSGNSDAITKLRTEKLDQLDKRDAAIEALAKIRESLVQAQAEARVKRLAKLRADYADALMDYFSKAEIALAAFESAICVKTAAVHEGFGNEVAALTSPPHVGAGNPIIGREAMDKFRLDWSQIDDRQKSKPATRLTKIPALATRPAPQRMTDTQGPVSLGQPQPLQQRTRRALRRDPQPTDENMVLVFVVRAGVEVQGIRCAAGDRIAVPKAIAESLVKSGAADFVRPGSQVEPFPSTDIRL